MLSAIDRKIVRALQGDFPLVAEPYKELAKEAGVSEEEFLSRVKAMAAEKKIRKMGAVLRHREIGYGANALCVWRVPEGMMDEAAKIMSRHSAVSHCYDRDTGKDWPYNLYTMIHAKSREECEKIVEELSALTGISDRLLLYSKKEWKKTGMKYFCEDLGNDYDKQQDV